VCTVRCGDSFSRGAPLVQCDYMTPKHQGFQPMEYEPYASIQLEEGVSVVEAGQKVQNTH